MDYMLLGYFIIGLGVGYLMGKIYIKAKKSGYDNDIQHKIRKPLIINKKHKNDYTTKNKKR